MTKKINSLKTKLEMYAVYRIIKSIHDWVVEQLDICKVFPICLGFIGWLVIAWVFFAKDMFAYGIISLMLYVAYWLHIFLFEE